MTTLLDLFFLFLTDGYKLDHRRQYPPKTEYVYANFTARKGRDPHSSGVVNFGILKFLNFLEHQSSIFFDMSEQEVVRQYQAFLDSYLGPNDIGTDHIKALWELGYLPLEFRALPEGIFVSYGIPLLTVENTHHDFFWLTNYIETVLSAEMWLPITSATTARAYRVVLEKWAAATSDIPELVDWQAHDFSFRGMTSVESAISSGIGHLLFFSGTDTIPAIIEARYLYNDDEFVAGSVPATEHSVMCAGGQDDEEETFTRLLEDVYPSGIVSVVSDTWDLWHVLTVILPNLKEKILARDGKLVIRPDSGDPADILCGDLAADPTMPQYKGVIELLWDLFGGEINSKGYKQLDSHIGAIYGDSITLSRAHEICRRLAEKGFASTNVVFGVGSYTYQYVTRDIHGFAMKATAAQVDGVERALFKKPVTDDGTKTSACGRLAVQEINGKLTLIQNLTREEWENTPSLLEPIWRNGHLLRHQSFTEVRTLARSYL